VVGIRGARMIEINDGEILLTPYKWTYEERILYKHKGNKFFEKNYSKWATLIIDHIDDLIIISERKYHNLEDEPCYLVKIDGGTHMIDAEDTYYEHWWGNKKFKKEFKDNDEYGYMDSFLTAKGHDAVPEEIKITAMISKKDYQELQKRFNTLA
jgi:hypothetical protein